MQKFLSKVFSAINLTVSKRLNSKDSSQKIAKFPYFNLQEVALVAESLECANYTERFDQQLGNIFYTPRCQKVRTPREFLKSAKKIKT